MLKLFVDTEFTGLRQDTTLISIGIRADNGMTFYAEVTDFNQEQVTPWLQKNIIDNLFLSEDKHGGDAEANHKHMRYKGPKKLVRIMLKFWLSQFPANCQLWYDTGAYDHVLVVELLADFPDDAPPRLPEQLHYIPMDLSTLLELANLDPDINREHLAGPIDVADEIAFWGRAPKHNALWDAFVIEQCYHKAIAKLSAMKGVGVQ